MFPAIPTTSNHLQVFKDARASVGYRVRARQIPRAPVPPGMTGTVAFAVSHESRVFLAVAWDCLTEWVEWYLPETAMRLVSIEGAPIHTPRPAYRLCREFTTAAAFARLGRVVTTRRPVSKTLGDEEEGTVRSVIADARRIMLSVSWHSRDANPDSTWFSRAEYDRYLTEHR